MATKDLSIRLSLDGAQRVLGDLKAVGGSGEKAMKRIGDASRPASRAMQALSNAVSNIRGRLEGMADHLGAFGRSLVALGPVGLGVAAGLAAITGGAIAMVAGLRKALSITDQAIEKFDALNDKAQQLGISAERMQAIGFGGLQIGVSVDETTRALTKLNDAFGDALIKGEKIPDDLARAFSKLGVSQQEIIAAQGDLDTLLPRIADGFKGLGSHAERTSVAIQLFGRQGARLLPLLVQGAAGIDAMTEQARSSGAVLKKEYVDILEAAGDRIAALKEVSGVSMGVIGAQFAGVSVKLAEFRTRTEQAIAAWVERSGLGGVVEAALDRVSAAVSMIVQRFGGFDAIGEKIKQFVIDITGGKGSIEDFARVIEEKVTGAIAFFRELANIITAVASGLRTIASVGEGVVGFLNKVNAATQSAGQAVYRNVTQPVASALGIGGGKGGGATGSFGPPLPQAAAPALGPAQPSARPQQTPWGPHQAQIGGALDVNIRSNVPATAKAKTADPRVPINVNQGLNLGLP